MFRKVTKIHFKKIRDKICKIDNYRIRNWYYYLGFPLLGLVLSGKWNNSILKILLLSSVSLAFAYSFNNYEDKETDKKFFLLPLFILAILLFFLNSYQIIVVLIFIILSVVYSANIVKLKRRPGWGTLCNAFAFPQLFFLGYFQNRRLDTKSVAIFLLLASLGWVTEIFHEGKHKGEDEKKQIFTTVVYFGTDISKNLCIIFILISLVLTFLIFSLSGMTKIALLALCVFQIKIFSDLLRYGLRDFLWHRFRIYGIIAGIVWYLTAVSGLR